MADSSEPDAKQDQQILQTVAQALQMAVQFLQKTEQAAQKTEQAPKKTVPEGGKLLYSTLEKLFFTWLVMFGSVSAFFWLNLASLSHDDRSVIAVAMFMLFLIAIAIAILMTFCLRFVKRYEDR